MCQRIGIKAGGPRREMEELLRPDPKGEDNERDRESEEGPPPGMKFIFAPEGSQERGAQDRLQRINPKLRRRAPERRSRALEGAAYAEQEDESEHRDQVRPKFSFSGGLPAPLLVIRQKITGRFREQKN